MVRKLTSLPEPLSTILLSIPHLLIKLADSSVPNIATNSLEQTEYQKLFAFDTVDSGLSDAYPHGSADGGCLWLLVSYPRRLCQYNSGD